MKYFANKDIKIKNKTNFNILQFCVDNEKCRKNERNVLEEKTKNLTMCQSKGIHLHASVLVVNFMAYNELLKLKRFTASELLQCLTWRIP